MFIQIAELEDEFRGKQEQKLCSLGELQSLKARTEEKLGDNLLSDIQGAGHTGVTDRNKQD